MPEYNSRIDRLILRARLEEPYFWRGYSRLTPVEREVSFPPGSPPTMATNSRWQMFWSDKALDQWTEDEAVQVIKHELRHCLRNHFKRSAQRDPSLFNTCGDMEINDELPGLPGGCVYPKTFGFPDHLLAEEYYNMLQDKSQQGGGPSPQGGCRGGQGLGHEPFDGDADGIDEVEAERLRAQVAQDVSTWRKEGRGDVPLGEEVWANSVLEELGITPPWQRLLRGKIKNAVPQGRGMDDWSRSIRNRRNGPLKPVRPGWARWRAKVGLVLDTSGSMHEAGGKVKAVIRQVELAAGKENVIEWDCDAEAHKRTNKKAAHVGGGGTDMMAGIKAALKETGVAVVVTDGDSPWDEKAPEGGKVVVVIVDGGSNPHLPSWAEAIVVK